MKKKIKILLAIFISIMSINILTSCGEDNIIPSENFSVETCRISYADQNGIIINTTVVNKGDVFVSNLKLNDYQEDGITYKFVGWSMDNFIVSENVEITPVFVKIEDVVYKVTFYDQNDKEYLVKYVREHDNAEYFTLDNYEDIYYNYYFTGWDVSLSNITKDSEIKPVFRGNEKDITVKYKKYDGTYEDRIQNATNLTPAFGLAFDFNDEYYDYTFVRWELIHTPTLEEYYCEYESVYEKTDRLYEVTYIVAPDVVVESGDLVQKVKYNETPICPNFISLTGNSIKFNNIYYNDKVTYDKIISVDSATNPYKLFTSIDNNIILLQSGYNLNNYGNIIENFSNDCYISLNQEQFVGADFIWFQDSYYNGNYDKFSFMIQYEDNLFVLEAICDHYTNNLNDPYGLIYITKQIKLPSSEVEWYKVGYNYYFFDKISNDALYFNQYEMSNVINLKYSILDDGTYVLNTKENINIYCFFADEFIIASSNIENAKAFNEKNKAETLNSEYKIGNYLIEQNNIYHETNVTLEDVNEEGFGIYIVSCPLLNITKNILFSYQNYYGSIIERKTELDSYKIIMNNGIKVLKYKELNNRDQEILKLYYFKDSYSYEMVTDYVSQTDYSYALLNEENKILLYAEKYSYFWDVGVLTDPLNTILYYLGHKETLSYNDGSNELKYELYDDSYLLIRVNGVLQSLSPIKLIDKDKSLYEITIWGSNVVVIIENGSPIRSYNLAEGNFRGNNLRYDDYGLEIDYNHYMRIYSNDEYRYATGEEVISGVWAYKGSNYSLYLDSYGGISYSGYSYIYYATDYNNKTFLLDEYLVDYNVGATKYNDSYLIIVDDNNAIIRSTATLGVYFIQDNYLYIKDSVFYFNGECYCEITTFDKANYTLTGNDIVLKQYGSLYNAKINYDEMSIILNYYLSPTKINYEINEVINYGENYFICILNGTIRFYVKNALGIYEEASNEDLTSIATINYNLTYYNYYIFEEFTFIKGLSSSYYKESLIINNNDEYALIYIEKEDEDAKTVQYSVGYILLTNGLFMPLKINPKTIFISDEAIVALNDSEANVYMKSKMSIFDGQVYALNVECIKVSDNEYKFSYNGSKEEEYIIDVINKTINIYNIDLVVERTKKEYSCDDFKLQINQDLTYKLIIDNQDYDGTYIINNNQYNVLSNIEYVLNGKTISMVVKLNSDNTFEIKYHN